MAAMTAMGRWARQQWLAAAATAAAYGVAVAVPTDLVDTPLFSREIPPTWWARPSLAVSAVLVGLLAATYVSGREPAARSDHLSARTDVAESAQAERSLSGYLGGFLSFFAVGCPVCNKLVLLAVGYSGALTWFQPLQPLLQLLGIALLTWALRRRLSAAQYCPIPSTP